ncbi:MAG: site-2 protease family protein, partial [Raoultibacter sp.]
MDIVLMILYITIVLSVLVFIHEGGHYLVARAFGVRV